MTSKYWRGPHGLTHPKSFVALTNLWCFGYFRKADTMFMFLWNMQRYGGVNSFLWTGISCDWFKREPLPNDNIKYSELQFNWYDCLMSCDNVSIMKRVLECCQTNLLDRVMSEWSGCASPSVTKALPFLTSCEPPDTQRAPLPVSISEIPNTLFESKMASYRCQLKSFTLGSKSMRLHWNDWN